MNSKEKLEKLLDTDSRALENFRKIAELPKEEMPEALQRFEQEFSIELNVEDFTSEALGEEQLKAVSGGVVDPVSVAGLIVSVYGLYPTSTGRGTQNGTKRYNK